LSKANGSYLVFVALNAIAPIVALLLSNPPQVQRKDRLPVPAFPAEGFFREIWLTIKELRDPRIIACEPLQSDKWVSGV
jgi:hypothetical protein